MGKFEEITELKEQVEYYQNLAEMYQFEYDTQIKPSKDILTVQGVLYQMESESLSYAVKYGESKKIKDARLRLKILMDFVEGISQVNSRNTELRILLKQSMLERDRMETKLKESEKELENVRKAWNQLPTNS